MHCTHHTARRAQIVAKMRLLFAGHWRPCLPSTFLWAKDLGEGPGPFKHARHTASETATATVTVQSSVRVRLNLVSTPEAPVPVFTRRHLRHHGDNIAGTPSLNRWPSCLCPTPSPGKIVGLCQRCFADVEPTGRLTGAPVILSFLLFADHGEGDH